tara:strand:+ start:957 stop:1442 length:486 start_codon:yes stop_codon:yes gene_type:complete
MLTIRILKIRATSKKILYQKKTLRKLRMEVSLISRLDSQKSKEELNKKINKETTEVFIPTKLTCHHQLEFKTDQLKAEPAKRTKMKTLKSSKRSDPKKSRVKKEPFSILTKIKHRLLGKMQGVKDVLTLWPRKKKIYRLGLKWASPSLILKSTSRIAICCC